MNFQLTHIILSIASVGVLCFAVLLALVAAFQERRLRSRAPSIFNRLPPLESMEHLLFRSIALGCVLLLLSLIMGFIFLRQAAHTQFVHQTGLSILALLMFSGLLFGRYRFGWRGRVALYLTLASFVLLLIAYFFSHLI